MHSLFFDSNPLPPGFILAYCAVVLYAVPSGDWIMRALLKELFSDSIFGVTFSCHHKVLFWTLNYSVMKENN